MRSSILPSITSSRLLRCSRKCIVLAHQLQNERLKVWSNGELNGYSSIEKIFKNIEPLEQQRLDSLLALVGHAFSRAYLLQY